MADASPNSDQPSEPAEPAGSGERPERPARTRLRAIIFEADTRIGRAFDVLLLGLILASIVAVSLESVDSIRLEYGEALRIAEWAFTIFFTIEYILRLYAVKKPLRYAFSFFGIIDLLAILPTYLSVLLGSGQALIVVRALRLMRVFRVLKFAQHIDEARVLATAMRSSAAKITVFLLGVMSVVMIMGTLMYLVEAGTPGAGRISNIPEGMYWAIVTMTTVGYGDFTPHTVIGRFIAAMLMMIGYSVLAVPTGIVSMEYTNARVRKVEISTRSCGECLHEGHDPDAAFCKKCGAEL